MRQLSENEQLLRIRAEKASAGVSTWRSAGHMVHLALGRILYNVYLSTTSAFLRTVALNNLTFSRSWTRFVASTYLVCRWMPASRIRSPLFHSKSSCSWEVLHLEPLGIRIDGMVVFYKIGLWSLFCDTYYSLELAEAVAALIHEMISSNNRSYTPSFSLCNSWYFPCQDISERAREEERDALRIG